MNEEFLLLFNCSLYETKCSGSSVWRSESGLRFRVRGLRLEQLDYPFRDVLRLEQQISLPVAILCFFNFMI